MPYIKKSTGNFCTKILLCMLCSCCLKPLIYQSLQFSQYFSSHSIRRSVISDLCVKLTLHEHAVKCRPFVQNNVELPIKENIISVSKKTYFKMEYYVML